MKLLKKYGNDISCQITSIHLKRHEITLLLTPDNFQFLLASSGLPIPYHITCQMNNKVICFCQFQQLLFFSVVFRKMNLIKTINKFSSFPIQNRNLGYYKLTHRFHLVLNIILTSSIRRSWKMIILTRFVQNNLQQKALLSSTSLCLRILPTLMRQRTQP